jgi:hypothetical protein
MLGSNSRRANDESNKKSLLSIIFEKLQEFRKAIYDSFGLAKNTAFKLMNWY